MQVLPTSRRLRISPKAFQLACRYVSFARLLGGTKTRISSDRVTGERSEDKRDNAIKHNGPDNEIRWFEKDPTTGKVTQTDGDPDRQDLEQVKNKVSELRRGLKRMTTDIHSEEYHQGIVEMFPREEQKAVSRALAQERQRRQELMTGLEISLEPLPLAAPILREFNTALRRVADNPDVGQHAASLWSWYVRAKRSLPGLDERMPQGAWKVLWDTQLAMAPNLEGSEQRLFDLSSNMKTAGLDLTLAQLGTRLRAMVDLGKQKQALSEWQKVYDDCDGQDQAVLALGVTITASCGNIQSSIRTLRLLQDRFPDHDPRVVHNLIQNCIKAGSDGTAYALYLDLQKKLADEMNMRDYDIIAARFLASNKKDLALAVFRDMMIQGTKGILKSEVSIEQERKLIRRFGDRMEVLESQSTSSRDISSISLSALSSLPVQWQNKFFFASWIKKLLGMGDVSGAASVTELMYDRGIAPDAHHFNGIIGGYLRFDDSASQECGENLAWSMVRGRLARAVEIAQERQNNSTEAERLLEELDDASQKGGRVKINVAANASRPLPMASSETYNVLGLHYLLKQQWSRLRQLARTREAAGIVMSPFFMDHLLYMELYQNDPAEMWIKFLQYTKLARPDIETFNCLWHAQQILASSQRTSHISRISTIPVRGNMPGPRKLFEIMMSWLITLNAHAARKASADFTEEIYARIITSFCDRNDLLGAIVAIHAIRDNFNVGLPGTVMSLIVNALANKYEPKVPRMRGRRGRVQMPVEPDRAGNVTKALELLKDRRVRREILDMTVVEGDAVHAEALQDCNLLSELVRTVVVGVEKDPGAFEEAMQVACREMGVAGISTGDVDAFHVL